MNKAAHQFRTYLWIVETIRRCQPITLGEIMRRWTNTSMSEGEPLNRRTFIRARNAVEEMFDIRIECSGGGGPSATYSIDGDSLRGNSLQRWMLSTMSVSGAVRDARQVQDRILLESVPSGDLLLTEVTRAMQNNHTLRVRYQKFVDSEPYEAEVEPYCLKLFHQRWYMLAHRIDRTYLAIYALDRMLDAVETDTPFSIPADFEPESYFYHMFGVFQPSSEQKPQRVLLRTYNGEWNYLRTLPLHHTQREIGGGDGFVDFSYTLCATHDFKMELLSRITNIEVLEPSSLRQDIREMLLQGVERNS